MGCGHSSNAGKSAKVSPKKKSATKDPSKQAPIPDNANPCSLMYPDFERVLNGVTKIYRPQTTYFVSCLSNYSIPILKSSIKRFFEEEMEFSLPAIGIARYGQGRIMCLGNIEYLVNEMIEEEVYFHFFENSMRYIRGNTPAQTNILLLGLSQIFVDSIKRILKNYKSINIDDAANIEGRNLSDYSIIFIKSNCTFHEEIHDYVYDGGGLVCSACLNTDNPDQQFTMNKTLSKCGIGFVPACKTTETSQKGNINLNLKKISPAPLEKLTFPYIVGQYCALLGQDTPEVSIVHLTVLLTHFRINLACFHRTSNPLFEDILTSSFKYLEKTNYRQQEGIIFLESQHMISIFLSDVFIKLSCELITADLALKCSEIFPGHFSPEKVEDIKVTVNVPESGLEWFSTGLWLPAGLTSEVKIISDITDHLSIQIGSHADTFFDDRGPYKRWPAVTQLYQVESKRGELEIASPFGGLIYIVLDDDSATSPSQINSQIEAHFTNVCKSPYFKHGKDNSDQYELIRLCKNKLSPYGEIETKFVCFTLPSSEILKIQNIDKFSKYFDGFARDVFNFVGYKPTKRFRIVFDVQLPFHGSTSSYPLMLSCDSIENIFLNEEPSSELFSALLMISILSLPEDSLNPIVEAALASLAVAHAFKIKWSDVEPFQYINGHTIPLLNELWEIYLKIGPKPFSISMTNFQQLQAKKKLSNEESFTIIVNKLSSLTDDDFSDMIQNANFAPISDPTNLPAYTVAEEEDEEDSPD